MYKLFLCVFSCVALSSCALIMGGTEDPITFTSEPSGAEVFIDGQAKGVTPATIEVKTSDDVSIVLKKSGYKDAYVRNHTSFDLWTIGDVVVGGLIGFLVDWFSDAMWDHENSVIHTTLKSE